MVCCRNKSNFYISGPGWQDAESLQLCTYLLVASNEQISDLMTAWLVWEKPLAVFLRALGPAGITEPGTVAVAWPKTTAGPWGD